MSLGALGQAEVFLNIFADATQGVASDLGDVISRHLTGWPDPASESPDSGPLLGADPAGVVDVPDGERVPPGEPSGFWYTVGPFGWFYWQWAFVGTLGTLLLVSGDSRGRRRR
jgi:hypothetical protein